MNRYRIVYRNKQYFPQRRIFLFFWSNEGFSVYGGVCTFKSAMDLIEKHRKEKSEIEREKKSRRVYYEKDFNKIDSK